MSVLTESAAMARALELAATPGVPLGPNPRVGCVLLADDGTVIAEGYHRGAGTAHAEAGAAPAWWSPSNRAITPGAPVRAPRR